MIKSKLYFIGKSSKMQCRPFFLYVYETGKSIQKKMKKIRASVNGFLKTKVIYSTYS